MAVGDVEKVNAEAITRALIDEPVTDAEVAQLRVLLADESMHQTQEDASWCNVLSRLLARIEQDATVIAQLTKERDAAFAGGEELSAALRMANAEVARLRKVTGPDCPVCSKLLLAEHVLCVPGHHRDNAKDYYVCHDRKCRITVADLIANHPVIAREMGVTNE